MDIRQDNVAQLQNAGARNHDKRPTKLVPHLLNVLERLVKQVIRKALRRFHSDSGQLCELLRGSHEREGIIFRHSLE